MAPNALNFVPFIGESTALEIQYVFTFFFHLPVMSSKLTLLIRRDQSHQQTEKAKISSSPTTFLLNEEVTYKS